jgi:Ser/Thr protein kinase RdoA (MazF antagonist)
LRVARRLGFSDDHQVVAFEWLPGKPMLEAIQDLELDPHALVTVGAAVAALHAQEPRGLEMRSRKVEIAGLISAALMLGLLNPPLAARAQDLALRIAGQLAQMPPLTCGLHGDFVADQVLLEDQVAGILDFDKACRGDPASDLGSMIGQWESFAARGQLSIDRIAILRHALLEGYLSGACSDPRDRIAGYVAAVLLGHAVIRFKRHEPNWPEQMEALVGRAETVLDGG